MAFCVAICWSGLWEPGSFNQFPRALVKCSSSSRIENRRSILQQMSQTSSYHTVNRVQCIWRLQWTAFYFFGQKILRFHNNFVSNVIIISLFISILMTSSQPNTLAYFNSQDTFATEKVGFLVDKGKWGLEKMSSAQMCSLSALYELESFVSDFL